MRWIGEAEAIDGVGALRRGSALFVALRRPKALNALDIAMVRRLRAVLDEAAEDGDVACVLLAGEGGRAFCAGGDIRAIHASLDTGEDVAGPFWREEYDLLLRIERFPKPVAVWMDGIVMGGGVGLGMHASHRIVTEGTRLAMPETGIGYLPDVGATWRLPKAPGGLGTWMALTGEPVGAATALRAGLADRFMPARRGEDLARALEAAPDRAAVDAAIDALAQEPPDDAPAGWSEAVGAALEAPSYEAAVAALERLGGEAAERTLATLRTRSPASLHVTWRMLELGRRSRSLAECLDREWAASMRIHREPDFREGVRAAVVDKDRNPRWAPWSPAEAADWDKFLGIGETGA